MKPVYLSALTLLLAGIVSYATTKAVQPTSSSSNTTEVASKKSDESVYDRVIRTGKIRCGYIVWPPFINKDPNTNKYSGIIYDFASTLAKSMELDLVMAEEFGLATYLQDLNNGRFDVECSGGWSNARRGKLAEYSMPIAYFPIVAVGRIDQKQNDSELDWINDSSIKVSVIDGETSSVVRNLAFPKSQAVELPNIQNSSDLLMQVVTKKADVTFTDVPSILTFQKNNPGKVKILSNSPVRIVPINMALPAGAFRLKGAIDTAIQELLNDGVIDSILDKYDPEKKIILRVAKPYEVTQ